MFTMNNIIAILPRLWTNKKSKIFSFFLCKNFLFNPINNTGSFSINNRFFCFFLCFFSNYAPLLIKLEVLCMYDELGSYFIAKINYSMQGWGAGYSWLLGAGAAWKKTRSRSRLEKSQEPEPEPPKNLPAHQPCIKVFIFKTI